MAYSSGTFSRLFDWTDDRDNGIKIRADRFDQELDGFATGLSTALLKDGTQTATAKIPFVVGLSVIDNQTVLLGTNSDIAIQYDESTNDSLAVAVCVPSFNNAVDKPVAIPSNSASMRSALILMPLSLSSVQS